MKLSLWRAVGALVAPALASALAAVLAGCPCLDSPLLLQRGLGRRPEDCTCVNGERTYPTTPRDTLKNLGPVALRGHLEKCESEKATLEQQKEVQLAASKEQMDKIGNRLEKEKGELKGLKKDSGKQHQEEKAKHQQLTDECKQQEQKLAKAKGDYNKAYTKWYELSKKLAAKMGQMGCECQNKKSLLVERKAKVQSGALLSPDDETMYERIRQVEACENARLKISKELEADRKATGAATVGASDEMERLEQKQADHERLSSMMSKKPMIDALEDRKKITANLIASEEKRLKQQKEKNAKLEKQVTDLDTEITRACGC